MKMRVTKVVKRAASKLYLELETDKGLRRNYIHTAASTAEAEALAANVLAGKHVELDVI